MRHQIFSDIQRSARGGGDIRSLRLAEVKSVEDNGYILRWLSGNTRSDSAPARAAAFMAGSERGAYFPFEKGDEVVVGFVDNEEDYPIILGALWSGQDPVPPSANPSTENNVRTIYSRAGHQLTFDDTKSQEKLLLESSGGMKILMDDSTQTLTIQLNDTTRITFDSSGIKVEAPTINLN